MSNIAIQTVSLSKQYRIGAGKLGYRTIGDTLSTGFRRLIHRSGTAEVAERNPIIWALDDVSITCRSGTITAIIGRNGSGKTTLLKILAGITDPTRGFAELFGRPGALLEVGTGFHAELTGRENVYMNGAILGMTRREIDGKFDEIVAFAEVEPFIDTAVKYYSSGMYLRLAFSVASHLEPDILLIDEVLAVGDAEFQRKCIDRMSTFSRQGRTVLFVSHNLAAVQQLCTDGIVLDHGRLACSGTVTEALTTYARLRRDPDRSSDENSSLLQIHPLEIQPQGSRVFIGDPLVVRFTVTLGHALERTSLRLTLRTAGDEVIVYTAPDLFQQTRLIEPGTYSISVTIPPLWLKPGIYDMRVKAVAEQPGLEKIRAVSDPMAVQMEHPHLHHIDLPGYIVPNAQWDIRRSESDRGEGATMLCR
ncbi:ABC transporter ATP-binding protein [bacterium]|nr:ABC transporter ATP-binding protein [candidate division CSSED10-310 bacterium]